jgi:hypothetical protein
MVTQPKNALATARPDRRAAKGTSPSSCRPSGHAGFKPSGSVGEWRDVRGSIGVGAKALPDAGRRLQ